MVKSGCGSILSLLKPSLIIQAARGYKRCIFRPLSNFDSKWIVSSDVEVVDLMIASTLTFNFLEKSNELSRKRMTKQLRKLKKHKNDETIKKTWPGLVAFIAFYSHHEFYRIMSGNQLK